MLRALERATLIGVVWATSACGNSEKDPPGSSGNGGTGNPGGSGGSESGAAGTGGASGSGASNGGTAGSSSAGAGAAGTSGMGPSGGATGGGGVGGDAGASGDGGCAGEFGEERVIIEAAEDIVLSSPTVPGDELELFFVRRDVNMGARQVFVAERADKDASFGEPSPVSELDEACAAGDEWSLSITPDGLRVYIGCYTGSGMGTPGPLHLARRSSRSTPFVLEDMSYGTVGNGVVVTADELTALSSAEFDNAGRAPPVEYRRSSLDEAFGASRTIDGLEEVFITAPHLAPDGTTLFGALRPDLVMTSRSDLAAPFDEPVVLFPGEGSTVVYGSPEISADCRTLYFLRADLGGSLPEISLKATSR